jgi:hypothetical protein
LLHNGIRSDYGKLLEGEEIDELELVKWAMRKKFYQQALTLVESRFPNHFVNKGIFYYANDDESKKLFMDEMNKDYWSAHPKDRWWVNNVYHFFIISRE